MAQNLLAEIAGQTAQGEYSIDFGAHTSGLHL
jgi:hypothetical protein